MGYAAPRTWAALEKVRPYWLNTELRDNLKALRGLNEVACKLYLDGDKSTSSGSIHAIAWSLAAWNFGELWSSGTTITVPITGYYAIGLKINYGAASGGRREGGFRINGGTQFFAVNNASVATANKIAVAHFRAELSLTAGDRLEFLSRHSAGHDSNIEGSLLSQTACFVRLLGTV